MTIQQQLGKRIKYVRQAKGWSQLTLAMESQINRNYLSDLEQGRRNPSLKVLLRLARALNLDLTSLFQGIKSIE
jgi:transcriptional regulator with XRE-family HTH domain